MIIMSFQMQISRGAVINYTVGWVSAFYHRFCYDCNLNNSLYYKEYLQTDQDSTTVLQQISKIVSSSTYFKQPAGCTSAQFLAKWAFEVTWMEVGDYYAFRSRSRFRDTSSRSSSMVSIV